MQPSFQAAIRSSLQVAKCSSLHKNRYPLPIISNIRKANIWYTFEKQCFYSASNSVIDIFNPYPVQTELKFRFLQYSNKHVHSQPQIIPKFTAEVQVLHKVFSIKKLG